MSTEEVVNTPVVDEGALYEGKTSAEIRADKLSRFNRASHSDHTLVEEAMDDTDRDKLKDVVELQGTFMTKYWSDKLQHLASSYWNSFYANNTSNFFKDRHYLHREIPTLISVNDAYENDRTLPQPTLLEVGCGVGNTVYPILEDFPSMKMYACDYAPTAVELVKKHRLYHPDRVDAQVVDIEHAYFPYPPKSMNFATLVYVLSAINPIYLRKALLEVRRVMKEDGIVLLRDYAEGDLTQVRFKKGSKISERFYKRGDGTRTYFFERMELLGLFREAGFLVKDEECMYVKKIIKNRKRDLEMTRIWIQVVARPDPNWIPTSLHTEDGSFPDHTVPYVRPATNGDAEEETGKLEVEEGAK